MTPVSGSSEQIRKSGRFLICKSAGLPSHCCREPLNRLAKRSQIMVDKPQTPARGRLGGVIGQLDDATLLQLNRALAVVLGLA